MLPNINKHKKVINLLNSFKSKISRKFRKLKLITKSKFFGYEHLRSYFLHQQTKHALHLESLKNKISEGRKIKIVFLDISFGYFHFSSLYKILDKYEQIEPIVFVYSELGDGKYDLNEALDRYNKRVASGFNTIFGYDEDGLPISLESVNADIVFFSFYHTASRDFDNHYFRRTISNTLSCIVPYYILSLKANVTKYFTHRNVLFTWTQFLDNKYEHNMSLDSTITFGSNTVISGHPSRDLLENSEVDKILEKLKDKRKIVAYTPHWIDVASFYKLGKDILSLLDKYPDIGFVFKPHPTLYVRVFNEQTPDKVTNGWKYEDWENYVKKWSESENGVFITSSDSANLFDKCDLIINESETYILGWASTGKPCIQLTPNFNSRKKPEKTRLPYVNDLVNSYYSASTFVEIEKYFNDILLNDNDYKKQEREKVTKGFKTSENGSSQFIAQYLLEKLDIAIAQNLETQI